MPRDAAPPDKVRDIAPRAGRSVFLFGLILASVNVLLWFAAGKGCLNLGSVVLMVFGSAVIGGSRGAAKWALALTVIYLLSSWVSIYSTLFFPWLSEALPAGGDREKLLFCTFHLFFGLWALVNTGLLLEFLRATGSSLAEKEKRLRAQTG